MGIGPLEQAKQLAVERELDLVEVAPDAQPPVCRLMDYGRYKFEALKKEKESRRGHNVIHVKEMKLRPKISEHDFQTKFGYVKHFLADGDKVKLTIMFRGREMVHQEYGRKLLDRMAEELKEVAMMERSPLVEGRNMIMILSPYAKRQATPTKDGKDGVAVAVGAGAGESAMASGSVAQATRPAPVIAAMPSKIPTAAVATAAPVSPEAPAPQAPAEPVAAKPEPTAAAETPAPAASEPAAPKPELPTKAEAAPKAAPAAKPKTTTKAAPAKKPPTAKAADAADKPTPTTPRAAPKRAPAKRSTTSDAKDQDS